MPNGQARDSADRWKRLSINLVQFLDWFHSEQACRDHLEKLRRPDGLICPKCGVLAQVSRNSRGRWICPLAADQQLCAHGAVEVGNRYVDAAVRGFAAVRQLNNLLLEHGHAAALNAKHFKKFVPETLRLSALAIFVRQSLAKAAARVRISFQLSVGMVGIGLSVTLCADQHNDIQNIDSGG